VGWFVKRVLTLEIAEDVEIGYFVGRFSLLV